MPLGVDGTAGGFWVRSTRCHSGNCCVEVMLSDDAAQVLMRSSVTPERGVLSFSAERWAEFVDGIRAGEFDR